MNTEVKNVVISLTKQEEVTLIGFISRVEGYDLPENIAGAIDKFVFGMMNAHFDSIEEILDGRVDMNDDEDWIVFEEDYTNDEENDLIDALSMIRDSFIDEHTDEERQVLGKVAACFIADEMGELLKTVFKHIRERTREHEEASTSSNPVQIEEDDECDDPDCCRKYN